MNLLRPGCLVCVFAVVLATGCGKREEVQLADQAESTLPAEERMPAEADAPVRENPATTPPAAGDAPVANEAATAPDPALANVPAELLASDRAYEEWFKKYQLNLEDAKMLDEDSDGDGSSNRDEFMADTNPRDPNSRPGIHRFMRLKSFAEVKLPLMLESVEGNTAKIRKVDEDQPKTETVRAGESIGGMKVERVIGRRDFDKNGQPVDISRVVLADPSTPEKVILVKDMPARSAASSAVLTSSDGRTTLTVKQGDVFQWPTEEGTSYKVIDLRPEQVVVQEVESRKMWTIPQI